MRKKELLNLQKQLVYEGEEIIRLNTNSTSLISKANVRNIPTSENVKSSMITIIIKYMH